MLVQFRQNDGTASITVTPRFLIMRNSSTGSLRCSAVAITTRAPWTSGSSNWRRDEEKATEAV